MPNDIRALSLNWTKNGYAIAKNDHVHILNPGSEFTAILINSTECHDSGVYKVEVNLLNISFANISLNLTVKGCGGWAQSGMKIAFRVHYIIPKLIN